MTRRRKPDGPLPPRGLEAFRGGAQDLVVLSFPLSVPELPAVLTASERAVVRLVLDGRRTDEIATARRVSRRTVSNQLQSAYRKLGVTSRVELAAALSATSPDRRSPRGSPA